MTAPIDGPAGEAGDLIERLNQSAVPYTHPGSNLRLWLDRNAVLRKEAADHLAALQQERDAFRDKLAEQCGKTLASEMRWDKCKDLSKQGWSALSDARLFIAAGHKTDLWEAQQCIDLAQASFADTIIASERKAEASAALASSLQSESALQAEEIADLQDRHVSVASEAASLQRRVEELTPDKARLDWLIANEARISWSNDSEICNVWLSADRDGNDDRPAEGYPQKCYRDPRQAIDAVMPRAALTPPEQGGTPS